jgi:hypothetical protein
VGAWRESGGSWWGLTLEDPKFGTLWKYEIRQLQDGDLPSVAILNTS